jgi:hypothetical protein
MINIVLYLAVFPCQRLEQKSNEEANVDGKRSWQKRLIVSNDLITTNSYMFFSVVSSLKLRRNLIAKKSDIQKTAYCTFDLNCTPGPWKSGILLSSQ